MPDLSGFPYAEVRFDVEGAALDADERRAAVALPAQVGATDVLVISHGWNNDMAEARALYANLASSMRGVLDHSAPASYGDRSLAIIGVLWPSKRFAESDLIPGGAASVGGGADAEAIRKELDELADFLDRDDATQTLKQARELVEQLGDDPGARTSFADLVRQAVGGVAADADDASDEFFEQDGAELMDRLGRPVFVGSRPAGSLTHGGAAGLGDLVGTAFRAARNLLNVGTYYEMKARAGTVGETGVAALLADLRKAVPDVRIHLAGHSFGARVVSAAARAGDEVLPIASVSLLQAAFSHYSFADDWEPGEDGLFRSVVLTHRISGPMVITHTKNDKAVGIAYAIASRIAGQVAQAVGDKDDKYGGLGRNGAQKTPEAVDQTLLAVGDTGYDIQAGRLHNLLADAFISSHGDVAGPEVAYAVLSVVATT
jgi:pimeloyl-ACP methyl ester carboxylesterase